MVRYSPRSKITPHFAKFCYCPKLVDKLCFPSKRTRGGVVAARANSPADHLSERYGISMKILDMPRSSRNGLAAKRMNARPSDNPSPAIPQSTPRRRRGIAAKHRQALLGARDLQQHRELMNDGRLKSGRAGAYVYYVCKGQQRPRLFVVPRDPRTLAQQRSRARFGAASRTWSAAGPLTDQQRQAWRIEGAKTRSRPRLFTSGKLTGQQAFVGRNCAKSQREHSLLLKPAKGEPPNQANQPRKLALIAKISQFQRVTESTWDRHRTYTGALPWHYRHNMPHAKPYPCGRKPRIDPDEPRFAGLNSGLAAPFFESPPGAPIPAIGKCRFQQSLSVSICVHLWLSSLSGFAVIQSTPQFETCNFRPSAHC